MSDAYRQMLDDVVAGLTGLATTTTSVFESPAYALASGKIPALAIVPRSVIVEVVAESADGDEHLERHTLGVTVTSIATTPAQRDQSGFEVKQKLLNDLRPGYSRRFSGSDFEESRDGERALFAVSQRFEIVYHVEPTAPDVIVT